jgi:putative transposase
VRRCGHPVHPADLLSDALADGRHCRVLAVVDRFTSEGLAIRADGRSDDDQVVAVPEEIIADRGRSSSVRVDNGPEFVGRSLELWAYSTGWRRLSAARANRPTTP